MNLYHAQLMDHYKNPRNYGTLDTYNFQINQLHPSCGDAIGIQGLVQDSTLVDIGFTGKGCVISQATASLLTEKIKGMPLSSVLALNGNDIKQLIGIDLGPLRLQCALLSLYAIKMGIAQYKEQCA